MNVHYFFSSPPVRDSDPGTPLVTPSMMCLLLIPHIVILSKNFVPKPKHSHVKNIVSSLDSIPFVYSVYVSEYVSENKTTVFRSPIHTPQESLKGDGYRD